MKIFLLIATLFIGNFALANNRTEYILTILDANNEIVAKERIQVIYGVDTLMLETNKKGQIKIDIRAIHCDFICGTGPLFAKAPELDYFDDVIRIVHKGREGNISKHWDAYFDQPKRKQKDKYNYFTTELIEAS